jgi:circadian clock protein KaiC
VNAGIVGASRIEAGGADRAPTGIAGLDDVLDGGFPRSRLHLVQGNPGAGKTTLGLQFLLEGARAGEAGLYVTLLETREELLAIARSHGWSLDPLTICEPGTREGSPRPDVQYMLFHPSEVELAEVTRRVTDQVERLVPRRVVIDPLTELRLLARDPLRFRRQMVGLQGFFKRLNCTVLLLDEEATDDSARRIESLVTGVVTMEQLLPAYGAERRRLRITKLRGVRYRGGYHDFSIRTGGIVLFPRLVAAEHRRPHQPTIVASGIPELDALVGEGLESGTSTLVLGPAGSGKSAIATRYALTAADRGDRAVLYIFDESVATFGARSTDLGMDLTRHLDTGRLLVQEIDPTEISPGEFAQRVRDSVVHDGARVVVIDSLNGYLNAMPDERFLTAQFHELLKFLGQRGVLTLVVCVQHGLVGEGIAVPLDVSYLVDTVLLLRNFEAAGELRQAISVVKKRRGRPERTARELRLGRDGIGVGEPLTQFPGVLTGNPCSTGGAPELLGGSRP